MTRRVVVTGAGVVSSIGVGADQFWQGCLQGKAVIEPVPANWLKFTDLHSRFWSPLPDVNTESFGVGRAEKLRLDPGTVYALVAARQALDHAQVQLVPHSEQAREFTLGGIDCDRVGAYLGTGIGGAYTFLHTHAHHLLQRPRAKLKNYLTAHPALQNEEALQEILTLTEHGPRYNPFVVSMLMPNASSAAIAIKFSMRGPNTTYCVACASGTVAIGSAFRAIREGTVDLALGGGSEYLNDEHGHIFRGFDVSGTLLRDCADPDTANRPFDQKRSGFLFSQGGAAVLVLEELEHAQRRDAPILAEVVGYGTTFDAYSMMSLAPGAGQIERMVRSALRDANLDESSVDYVNAHGTGTKNNDETEAEVIDRVFGRRVLVNSTKSLLGHTIGAAGAIEALVSALSLRDQVTHICKNLENPLRDLNFVRSAAQHDIRVAISQSFAFGGHNAALVLGRFP